MRFTINKNSTIPALWNVATVFDKEQPFDLEYPEKLVKAIKCAYYKIGISGIKEAKELKLFMNDKTGNDKGYFVTLLPDTLKALKAYFADRDGAIDIGLHIKGCPKSEDLGQLLLDVDKYFTAIVILRQSANFFKNYLLKARTSKVSTAAEYFQELAFHTAVLAKNFNSEMVNIINKFLNEKRFECGRVWYQIYLNKAFILSSTPYVAIRIIEFAKERSDDPDDLADDLLVYENYSTLDVPDRTHRVKPSGSFLHDCQDIITMKENNEIDIDEPDKNILDFHDLIVYGPFSSKILSLPILDGINKIFGHKQWICNFFLAIALVANKKIPEKLVKTTDLIDPSKVPNYDLFLQAVDFLDAHYDEIIDPDLKNE